MNRKTIILLLVGLGILALMVLFIGPGKIETALKNANPWYVATGCGSSICDIWNVDTKMVYYNSFTSHFYKKETHFPNVDGGFGC